ncbi:fumarate hydratase [Candidatus Uhrbacteria bacterium]|nr:fumarate hydratase [Candidatus Uhrbacteria bacterium]
MPKKRHQDPLHLQDDNVDYRLVRKADDKLVCLSEFEGQTVLKVSDRALRLLARLCLREINFRMRPGHNEAVAAILADPKASENDRAVAETLLRNAQIASDGMLPICQDTGTAIVIGHKGRLIWTEGNDADEIAAGIRETYRRNSLRYSQIAPLEIFREKNTGDNLPAQIDLFVGGKEHGEEYRFLFMAKGGGSANKTQLFQETPAILNPKSLKDFLSEKIRALGVSACPPYHIAVVIGGTSAESVMRAVKLASARCLDGLPSEGNAEGQAFRDYNLEAELLEIANQSGFGAQFGGRHFALDVRVIRMSRHGASCPIGLGVGCSADRQAFAKIDRHGLWMERLDSSPGRLLPKDTDTPRRSRDPIPSIDLNRPMDEIRSELSKFEVGTLLHLNGTILVARDLAHARFAKLLSEGKPLPEYLTGHPIFYAGPAKTPSGKPSGSFGPTTAGRMDGYVDTLQSHGASLVMIAKGNRSPQVTEACRKHGGFYLGSIGGAAAVLAKENIVSVQCLDYPELGMEAVWMMEVRDFPAFLLTDDKGNDFYRDIPS